MAITVQSEMVKLLVFCLIQDYGIIFESFENSLLTYPFPFPYLPWTMQDTIQTIDLSYPFTVSKEDSLDHLLQVLYKWGMAIIPDYLQADELSGLQQEFPSLLTHQADWLRQTPYSLGEAARITRAGIDTAQFPTLASVYGAPLMEKLTRLYLGPDAKVNFEIFAVKDIVGSSHIANDLHFDILKTFKFFIYLTDTTAKNGAIHCVPGSQQMTQVIRRMHGDKITPENRQLTRDLPVSDKDAMPVEGNAGTMIIFDTDVFHRAGTVHVGERWVLRGHSRPA